MTADIWIGILEAMGEWVGMIALTALVYSVSCALFDRRVK